MKKIVVVGLDSQNFPGAVTASVDAVEAEWGQVDKVVAVSTKLVATVDRRGREVAGDAIICLQKEFREFYKGRIEFIPMYVEFKTLDSVEAVREFWGMVYQQITNPRREGHEVYVALAEGDRRIDAILGNAAMVAAATKTFLLASSPIDAGKIMRGAEFVRDGEAFRDAFFSTVKILKGSDVEKRKKILHPEVSPVELPQVDLSFLVDEYALPEEERKKGVVNILLAARGAIQMPQSWNR